MTFTHALPTNNYGPAKFIVSSSAANGTHTSISAALSAASSGDTVFIRDGIYTENLTMVPEVRLTAFSQSPNFNGVTITGKLTFTADGNYPISNLRLVNNGDFLISCSGANACSIVINNCELIGSDNTIIQYTNSNATSKLKFLECVLDLENTGIAIFTHSSAGDLNFTRCTANNSGSSTTANAHSAGSFVSNYSTWGNPYSSSGASASFNSSYSIFNTDTINTTALTIGSTGTQFPSSNLIVRSETASAISVGAGASFAIYDSFINSSNTNAITGSGTITYTGLSFQQSSTVNTTTRVQEPFFPKVSPTVQVLTSGTAATYTTPANCQWIRVRAWGGGAGGQGSGTTPGAGGAGNNTTFSAGSMVAGAGGANGVQGSASSGGNVFNARGNPSGYVSNVIASIYGGAGGATSLGGAGGPGNNAPGAGAGAGTNTGSGGGGAGCGATVGAGFGGGSGGYSESIINSPAATYTYTIGAGGAGGTAGTSGEAGGAGAAGVIIVEEYYL